MNSLAILYLDDDQDDRTHMKRTVGTLLSNTFETFSNAESLYAYLRTMPTRTVVCLIDLVLDSVSGFDVVRTIREQFRHLAHCPMIIVTGARDEESKTTAREVGADAYIEKPVSVDVIMAALHGIGAFTLEIVDRREQSRTRAHRS